MTMLRISVLARIGAAVLAAGCVSAQAFICTAVLDPAALVKNSVTASESITGALQRASAWALQVNQLAVQSRQLTSNVDTSALTGNVTRSLAESQKMVSDLQQLYGSVSQVRSAMTRRLDEAKLAGLSWDAYVEHESARIKRNSEAAVARAAEEARMLQHVQDGYATANKTASLLPASSGMQDAMRVMNAQTNQLIVQAAQLERFMAPRAVAPGTVAEIRTQRAAKRQRELDFAREQAEAAKARREAEGRAAESLRGAP